LFLKKIPHHTVWPYPYPCISILYRCILLGVCVFYMYKKNSVVQYQFMNLVKDAAVLLFLKKNPGTFFLKKKTPETCVDCSFGRVLFNRSSCQNGCRWSLKSSSTRRPKLVDPATGGVYQPCRCRCNGLVAGERHLRLTTITKQWLYIVLLRKRD
jgi:hypothetical protein